jgi:hypothetical protein
VYPPRRSVDRFEPGRVGRRQADLQAVCARPARTPGHRLPRRRPLRDPAQRTHPAPRHRQRRPLPTPTTKYIRGRCRATTTSIRTAPSSCPTATCW